MNTEQFCFVPEMGLEPISLAAHDFESCVYTIPPLRQILRMSLEHTRLLKTYKHPLGSASVLEWGNEQPR